jgi:hypothetical protein
VPEIVRFEQCSQGVGGRARRRLGHVITAGAR